MIMENRSKRLSEPLRWGRREKAVVAVLASCVVIVLIGLGAYRADERLGGAEGLRGHNVRQHPRRGQDACLRRARQDPVRRPTGLEGDRAAAEAGLRRAGYPFE